MRKIIPLLIAFVLTAVGAAAADPEGRDCSLSAAQREALLQQSYAAFDEASEAPSWRALLRSGCEREAVALLEDYGTRNASKLTLDQRLELNFHIGQTLAFGGHDAEALPYFERAHAAGASAEWNAYVDATIAFLRKDRARLDEMRRRYQNDPAHDPMRVKIIDGLLKCLDRPYAQAVHCALGGDMH
jgi:hypothetical protein